MSGQWAKKSDENDNGTMPSNTSEHDHLDGSTLLGHLNLEREFIPNPGMSVKNVPSDKRKEK